MTLVRKGLVEQTPDPGDRRQKLLHLTAPGEQLWASLPDPMGRLYDIAFEGTSATDLTTIARVLSAATEQLLATRNGGTSL